MRTIRVFIICVVMISFTFSFAQNFATDGYWAGMIPDRDDLLGDSKDLLLMIYVSEGKARQIEYRKEEDKFYFVNHDKEIFSNLKNNLVFSWQNKGEVWSETQTFMLSSINAGAINVLWIRQVNNQDITSNEEWNIIREGVLSKYTERELAAAMRL
ncbi:MAG: hypothetical protein U1C58_03820 [Flavobacteriaceae bacterium]|nr:hypothetical protein [Flavobacteriaceae bacterium]MDZ4147392.1 hypothetical protein [Flavobacteriaceae bacterium]